MNPLDLSTMSDTELRTYVLEHREDTKAFQVWVDRFRANPNRRKLQSLDQLEQYLKEKGDIT